jgi:hypothetical protein
MKVTKKSAQMTSPERQVMDSEGSVGGVSLEEDGGEPVGGGAFRSLGSDGSVLEVAALG